MKHTNALLAPVAGCRGDHTPGRACASFSHCILPRKVPGLSALPTDTTDEARAVSVPPDIPLWRGLCSPALPVRECFAVNTTGGGGYSLRHPPFNTLPIIRCVYCLFPSFSEWLSEGLGFTRVLAAFGAGRMKSFITPDPILARPRPTEGAWSVPLLPRRTAREGWPLPRRRFGILDSFVSWASAWPSRTAESPCAQTLAVLCRLILPCAHQDSVCLHMLIPLQSPLGKSPLSAPGTEVLHLRRRDRSTFNKAKRTRPCLWRQSNLLQPSPGHCWWLILQGPWEVFAPASSCV